MGIIEDRRALHRIPELDVRLQETLIYVKDALAGMKCRTFAPIESSLCAFFDFGAEKTLAFRADMDALPIQEVSDAEYVSRHPGRMHACGHDGHMAMLLELARRMDRKETNPWNVLLVFQPAEETIGGAKFICQTGIFEEYRVEAIFGLHLWPGLETGVIYSRQKELMARCCEVNIDVYGKSAHIGRSWEGIDALAIGTEYYRRAVAMEQSMPEHIFRLLKFGKFESGTIRNALSAHTRIEGSLRAFQDDIFEAMQESLREIGRALEQETGCTISVTMSQGYPSVLNPTDLCRRVKAIVDYRELENPAMTSEDFSFYQRRIPGMFLFLGTGDSPALHTSNFDFDERVLEKGADFFETLAVSFR